MKKMRQSTLLMLSVTIAATLLGSIPVSAASQASPWDSQAALKPDPDRVNVVFGPNNFSLGGQPRLVKGSVMFPARLLLEELGYRVKWSEAEGRLTAVQDGRPTLTFRENDAAAEIGDRLTELPVAPFIDQRMLWIPLRPAAEAGGRIVTWNAAARLASVRNPDALAEFTVSARADNGVIDNPERLINYLNGELKVDAKIELLPPENYKDRTFIRIAAGDLRPVMLLEDSYPLRDELLRSIAVDLTKELEAFPRLKELAESPVGRVIDGKAYGIPRPFDPHDAAFPAIRLDWLEVFDLPQPQTMEELFQAMQKFADYDPDGNGKEDTLGLAGYVDGAGLGNFRWVEQAFTGSPDRFSVQDGKVVDHAVTPAEDKALEWLARAYAEGLINKDFATIDKESADALIRDGKTGLAAVKLSEAASLSKDGVRWVPLSVLKADSAGAPIAPWNSQGNGLYIVSVMTKTGIKEQLQWLERGMEMTETDKWDAVPGWTAADRSAAQNLFGQSDMLKNKDSIAALPEATRASYEQAAREWRKTSYEGRTLPQLNALWSQGDYAGLNNELEAFKLKVISGEATLEDWRQYRAELVASKPYQEMITRIEQLAGLMP